MHEDEALCSRMRLRSAGNLEHAQACTPHTEQNLCWATPVLNL